MSTLAKIWIVVASVLVILGAVLFVAVMSANQWDFTRLNTSKLVTNSHQISEDFHDISITADTAGIVFLLSDDGTCSVVCQEFEKGKHTVAVCDGRLSVDLVDERRWYEHIGINFGTPKITVYLPETEYGQLVIKEDTGDVQISRGFLFDGIDISASTGDVKLEAAATGEIKIKTSTGNICVEGVSSASLELSVSTGKVTVEEVNCTGGVSIQVSTGDASLSDVSCGAFTSSGDTGDITLKNVIVSESLSIKRSTGDVSFESCDAAEITVKTDTGSVKGSLLTEKVFIVRTDTGKIDVPESLSGGRCEITTDTGDIRISMLEQ